MLDVIRKLPYVQPRGSGLVTGDWAPESMVLEIENGRRHPNELG